MLIYNLPDDIMMTVLRSCVSNQCRLVNHQFLSCTATLMKAALIIQLQWRDLHWLNTAKLVSNLLWESDLLIYIHHTDLLKVACDLRRDGFSPSITVEELFLLVAAVLHVIHGGLSGDIERDDFDVSSMWEYQFFEVHMMTFVELYNGTAPAYKRYINADIVLRKKDIWYYVQPRVARCSTGELHWKSQRCRQCDYMFGPLGSCCMSLS